ncbi:hypothetical protein EJ08DRAFT_496512 [Tothia fuscella]|uniref:Uncharacterized protein n=1 Tax=Tothia fuscella TaxID=1048955 RepID=A0A9P4NZY9_9PEZI|nr:hypothetical protein EJ08DRAFT_496512 [Tothia fuscella]
MRPPRMLIWLRTSLKILHDRSYCLLFQENYKKNSSDLFLTNGSLRPQPRPIVMLHHALFVIAGPWVRYHRGRYVLFVFVSYHVWT